MELPIVDSKMKKRMRTKKNVNKRRRSFRGRKKTILTY